MYKILNPALFAIISGGIAVMFAGLFLLVLIVGGQSHAVTSGQ
jgi:hypothetical protein